CGSHSHIHIQRCRRTRNERHRDHDHQRPKRCDGPDGFRKADKRKPTGPQELELASILLRVRRKPDPFFLRLNTAKVEKSAINPSAFRRLSEALAFWRALN